MQKIVVTGAASFIGYKTVEKLLKRRFEVVRIDSVNDYYNIWLKNVS